MSTDRAICYMCGTGFSKKRGFFPVSYSQLHKGIGFMPYCRKCVDGLYERYLGECKNEKYALRQVCRKLDLYWDEKIFEMLISKASSRTMITRYLSKLSTTMYAGKSYDNTLISEGKLWDFQRKNTEEIKEAAAEEPVEEVDEVTIPDEVITFWGTGYRPGMYLELENRRKYWMSRFPDGYELDIGTEAIIRQICSLELDINRDRSAGRPVDKNINALNTLLGSANLRPAQTKKEDKDSSLDKTPLGVWTYRWEDERPVPDEYDDSPLLKYIFTWMGHVLHMLGVKNRYEQMYLDEIDRLRVEKPEYDDEDDEELLYDYMNEDTDKDVENSE